MSKRMKRRRFWAWAYAIFILLYMGVLAVLISQALSSLWDYAEEYEASQPDPVIARYVAELSENLWDESMGQTVTQMPHEFQSDEDVRAMVQSLLTDKISYARMANTDGRDEQVYNLYCGKNLFGRVTLVEDQTYAGQVEYGMLPWKVDREEFYFDGLYTSVRITVPAAYSITLNGREVSSDYIVEEGIHYDVLEPYYADYPDLPTKVTYQIGNIIGHLEPVVYDAQGNETVIDPEKDDSQFIETVDSATFERMQRFAEAFIPRYLEYISGKYDASYGYQRVLPYVQLGSDLDTRLKMAMDGVDWGHTNSVSIGYVRLDNAIFLGDNAYSLEISSECTAREDGRTTTTAQIMHLIVSYVGDDVRAVTMEISNTDGQG